MDPALRTAATGMKTQQMRVEVIANNLANVNTPGFKRSRPHFEDLLYQTVSGARNIAEPAASRLPEIQIGRGARLSAVQRMEGQGPIEVTGRPLDVAVEGDGFFQVELPDGMVGYTRDGSFAISDHGMLVTNGGYGLVPWVSIPPDATQVTISRSGIVSVQLPRETDPVEVGRLELARFPNPAGMKALGENLFVETAASGRPAVGYPQEDGMGRLLQGSLEGSNVEIVQEMVEMISAMRAYEINSKAIRTSEDMAQIASGLIR